MNNISKHATLYLLPYKLANWQEHLLAISKIELSAHKGDNKLKNNANLIITWAQKLYDHDDAHLIQNISRLLLIIVAVALITGWLTGWGIGATIFYYDGSEPINILVVLVTLVIIPNLLLIPTIVFSLAGSLWKQFINRRNISHSNQSIFTTGIHKYIIRYIDQHQKENLSKIIYKLKSLGAWHIALYAPIETLYISIVTQIFTVSLLSGAVFWGFWKALTTDLAFCWNTTAPFVTAQLIHSITQSLFLPWSVFFDGDIPSQHTIVNTRFYRLSNTNNELSQYQNDPIYMEQWWTFLMIAIVTWAILPRLLLLIVTLIRYSTSINFTVTHLPQAQNLLAELRKPQVTSTNNLILENTPKLKDANQPHKVYSLPDLKNSICIFWSMPDFDIQSLSLPIEHTNVIHTGGKSNSYNEDTLIKLINTKNDTNTDQSKINSIIIFVKSWEPPLLEFIDFLHILKQNDNTSKVSLYIIPLAFNKTNTSQVWHKVINRLGDPWIVVTECLILNN
jgi:hypothetical protein